ncbi:winged helix-turn-helix transcriptional regulator [Candidatus Woesearchaeota archaeon]|nr:winged helix-turn-helix transcriptional regulator [Candidatus Woesearchaeota archaeon]
MDLEPLFVESKWGVLQLLSEGNFSPLELAERLNTSISNISQQLRFLEMAGLVEKEKISNRDKGKPRMLFSLSKDYLYAVTVTRSFTRKKLLALSARQKMLMSIWFLDDPDTQYILEKFFWKLEEKVKDLKALALDLSAKGLRVLVVVSSVDAKEKSGIMRVVNSHISKDVEYSFFNEEEFAKKFASVKEKLYSLYDPQDVLLRLQKGAAFNGKRGKR